MADLEGLLQSFVDTGVAPGVVGVVARGDDTEMVAAGTLDADGGTPIGPDAIFRVASVTKPILAALAMMLVEDGVVAPDAPIGRWLPEVAAPVVVRTPDAALDDVVPARRAITVEDLLTFRAGWGFPADFGLPAVQPLFTELGQGPTSDGVPPPDEWMARLARLPLLHQPGEAWLYNTCSDVLGVLLARAAGRSLPDLFAERVFEPLGMGDTGFAVPADRRDRFTTAYRPREDGTLELADRPDGLWSTPPAFPSGAGGLVSTAPDWLAFGRMLLAGGVAVTGPARGRRLLSEESVRLMTTDHLTEQQRADSTLFLEGQGWGYGGSVDVRRTDPWTVPGRYGWVGGTGTAAHVVPSTGTVTILLTQREMTGPESTPHLHAFWRYAAG